MKNAFCVAKQATTEEKKRRCGILRIKYIIWFGHIASPLLTVLTQGIFTLRSHCRCGPCAECVTFFPSNIFEAQTKFGLFGHFNFGGFCFFLSFLHRIWSLRALYWLTESISRSGIFFYFSIARWCQQSSGRNRYAKWWRWSINFVILIKAKATRHRASLIH